MRRTMVALVVLGVLTLGSAASAVTCNRNAEWTTAGLTHGSSAGNPVNGTWLYEYVSSGDGLGGGDPWWDNAGTLSVYDNDWYGQGGVWARGDNVNPPIPPNRLTHNVSGGNYPYKPRVSWISPADGIVDVSGLMNATWGGGASTDLEVAIAKKAASGGYTLLASGTVKQAGPTTLDLTANPALQSVHVSAGDSIVWTTRGTAAGSGWVPLYDQGVSLTLDRGPHGDLLGHWTFDDPNNIGADASGLGNHGNVNNGPTSSPNVPAAIGSGNSLAFDGQNDHIVVPGISGDIDAFSVGFWLNPTSRANYDQQITGGGWDKFVFHTTSDGGVYTGVVQGGNWGSRFTPSQLPANTVELNTWQHFLFTYDKGTASFYKDGVRLATKTGMDLPSAWTAFTIGLNNGNTIAGLADDVAVWNGPLSAKAAQAIGNGWISPADRYATRVLNDSPIAYWRLDGAPGATVARDIAGGHDGIFSGNAGPGGPSALMSDPANGSAIFSGGSMRADTLDGLRDNFSVEFWTNPDTHTNYNQSLGADGGWAQFNFHTGANGEIWTGTGCCGGDRRFHSGDLGAGTFVLGEWQHYVFTFDELDTEWGLGRLYKDGTLLAERALRKGQAWTGFNLRGNLDGLIDDVAIYDYALSPEQVRAHYIASLPEPATMALLGLGLLGVLRRRRQ